MSLAASTDLRRESGLVGQFNLLTLSKKPSKGCKISWLSSFINFKSQNVTQRETFVQQKRALFRFCYCVSMVSPDMTFDFESLAEKIDQLAELTTVLRRENAALRIRNAALVSEQNLMNERFTRARERVAGLISTLPTAGTQKEEAGE